MIFQVHFTAKKLSMKENILKRPNVEIEILHQAFKKIEQLRMTYFRSIRQVIHRFKKAVAKSAFPNPVHNHPGEAGVLGRSQPISIGLFSLSLIFKIGNLRSKHGPGLNDIMGRSVVILIIMGKFEGLILVMLDLNI